MNSRRWQVLAGRVFCLFLLGTLIVPQSQAAAPIKPPEQERAERFVFLTNHLDRPLRYAPAGTDFVITNGGEFFNRPLYGRNSAFRVDAGDQPEFSLYLPGRGGNLRFGLRGGGSSKWLHEAKQVVARYRPGSMLYEIRDPLLGGGVLRLQALAARSGDGLIVRAESEGADGVELLFAFGGVNGMKGRRGGDIGCERQPVSRFFQLQAEQCAGNEVVLSTNSFTVRGKPGVIGVACSVPAALAVADAGLWADAAKLFALGTTNPVRPVVVGRISLMAGKPVCLGLQRMAADGGAVQTSAWRGETLPGLFSEAEAQRSAIAGRVIVGTPDPFINAAAEALNVAADAIWDDAQQSFMHGAVAWRNRLLGWRGMYSGDELGWHDRTAAHLAGFAKQQNTSPVPATMPAPEESANLSRNETALHSNGNLTKAHYDMNLLAVDAFFRHLLWTGDLDYARELWPVIERHFAWERRLFRREFGPEELPLYEGYAAIWASDDLAYNGGGATHSSALNLYANRMAARVARQLGKDPTPYEREADLISQAMQKYLWLPEEGSFAEFKDLLGLQLPHPNAALWTFYHTLDSAAATPEQAWRMSRWVDQNIAHFPVRGANVPDEHLFMLPTSGWMPYTWSLNNVVVAETAHTSLAFWQAGRPDAGFGLFKGTILDTMCLGLCPGNVGMTTWYDMARRESQRDFGDGVGAVSRALVEGLFGVQPDLLAGRLKIAPGFPPSWPGAAIRHPDFNFSFGREGSVDSFVVEPKFPKPVQLVLQIPAVRAGVRSLAVNGRSAKFSWLTNAPAQSRVEILADAAARWEVSVEWQGSAVPVARPESALLAAGGEGQGAGATGSVVQGTGTDAFDWQARLPAAAKLEPLDLAPFFNDRVSQIFRNEYRAPRSPFCSLAAPKQGIGSWCAPGEAFDVDDSGLRALAAKSGGRIVLPNGVPLATPSGADAKNIAFVSQWQNYPREISVPLAGKASRAFLLMAGSTGAMQSRFDNGEVVAAYADGSTARLALRNPDNWWPIDQDYYIDDFAFRRPGSLPVRVNLATGKIRVLSIDAFKGRGGTVPGGAATVLVLPLAPDKELKSLTVRALANEVVLGLMSVTLAR